MSALKLLLPFPRPRRADHTRLPAALSALLAAGVVLLFALPATEALRDDIVVAPLRLPPLNIATTAADPSIAARTLFTPTRSDSVGSSGSGRGAAGVVAAPLPLGGARIAGVSIVGGRTRVFVEAPGGKVRAVGRGSAYLGWRLAGVGGDSVEFRRGGERLRLVVGATAAAPAAPEADSEEEAQ